MNYFIMKPQIKPNHVFLSTSNFQNVHICIYIFQMLSEKYC